jgi:4-alpha-glucanotransferase
MSDALLAELARAADLEIDWIDALGASQQVSPPAQRSLLDAMGYPAQSPEQIRASLDELQQAARRHSTAALLFQEQGQAQVLAGHAAGTPYQLTDEQGQVSSGRLDEQARLPAITPPGYYRLEIAAAVQALAVVPAACMSVQQLCGKRHAWGLTAQLYALRRPGDGGLGDTEALAELARHAANHGADAIALSPVHALFSSLHEHYSPYSPSSRLFFNVLHAAPAAVLGHERLQHAIATCNLQHELQRLEALDLIDWPAVAAVRQRCCSIAASKPCTSTACRTVARPTGATGRRLGVIRSMRRSRPLPPNMLSACSSTPSPSGSSLGGWKRPRPRRAARAWASA